MSGAILAAVAAFLPVSIWVANRVAEVGDIPESISARHDPSGAARYPAGWWIWFALIASCALTIIIAAVYGLWLIVAASAISLLTAKLISALAMDDMQ